MPSPFPTASPLPLLPLRNGVLFPGTAVALPIGRRASLALFEAVREGDVIAVAGQRDPQVEDPGIADLVPIATYCRVAEIAREGRELRVVLEGLGRMKLLGLVASHPYHRAEGSPATEEARDDPETRALCELLLEQLRELEPAASEELRAQLRSPATRRDPGRLADVAAAALGLSADREAQVLLELDVRKRLELVLKLIAEARQLAELKSKLARDLQQELGKAQREALLRQQLRAIQKELGEATEGEDAIDKLRARIAEAGLPAEAAEVAARELKRLAGPGAGQAEASVIRSYLELIADLPWSRRAELCDDLDAVAAKLDADHQGLEEVKRRVLEHLAVRKVAAQRRGAILCLVGPPGVGKTSLGQSIADATQRPFVRVSLGGVRDEAEVRGHRRTYVGALPGRILAALRRAKVKNPLILLDEVDKLGHGGWLGSPEAALLEVLDPEQNHTFTDHYLELPFDLSEVLFICTANTVEPLSPPLRDRMEVIELQGYTLEEKLSIARRHLLPKRLAQHGIAPANLALSDDALAAIVLEYTREAGVRQLDRELTKICRALTLELARSPEGKPAIVAIERDSLRRYLGRERFASERVERELVPGVAQGLAWTPTGGELLFVETSRMPGKGRLEITGQLGDVMKESARAALSYLRSHAGSLGIEEGGFEALDLHLHVPAGAIPKDGPSAGVTIFAALASLLSGRRARSDTAMTGECTLRGRVLPVGGIKAKVLAAHRAGVTRVILPEQNRRDLDEVPEEIQRQIELVFVSELGQLLAAALEPAPPPAGLDPAALPPPTGGRHGVLARAALP